MIRRPSLQSARNAWMSAQSACVNVTLVAVLTVASPRRGGGGRRGPSPAIVAVGEERVDVGPVSLRERHARGGSDGRVRPPGVGDAQASVVGQSADQESADLSVKTREGVVIDPTANARPPDGAAQRLEA